MLVGSTVVELFYLSALSLPFSLLHYSVSTPPHRCWRPEPVHFSLHLSGTAVTQRVHGVEEVSPWDVCTSLSDVCVCVHACATVWFVQRCGCVRVWACVPDCVLSSFVFNVSSSEGPTDAHQRWFTSRPTLFSSKRSYFLRMETEPCSPFPSCTYTGQTVVWVVAIWCSRTILDRPALLLLVS
jgi:hypothetical protein